MGWPDLLSKRRANMRAVRDNLYVADELSSLDPCCQCDSSLPFGYSQLHTLAQRSRRPRDGDCNLLIPSGTTDHTKLAVEELQIDTN